jgi:hypothetical protein
MTILLYACEEPKCPDLKFMEHCMARGGDWEICQDLATASGAMWRCDEPQKVSVDLKLPEVLHSD